MKSKMNDDQRLMKIFTRSICSIVSLLHEDYRVNDGEILDNLVVDFVQNTKVSLEAKIFRDDNLVAKGNDENSLRFVSFRLTCERLRKAKRF